MDTATSDQAPPEASASAPVCEPVYVAVGEYGWGKGPTVDAARAQLLKALGIRSLRKRDRYAIKLLPPGAHSVYVDNFGTINWEGGDGSQCSLIEANIPAPSRGRK